MEDILWELYNGKLNPAEQYTPALESYRSVRKNYIKLCDEFIKKIGSPLDEEFHNILEEQHKIFPYERYQMFSEGFKLGAKLMMEILMDEDQNKE